MLKVKCGVSGSVRIVKTNSITGAKTGEYEFSNVWTTAGLARLSSKTNSSAPWPNTLRWGSGVRESPFEAVTTLKSQVGYGSIGFSTTNREGVAYNSEICTMTKTRTATQQARGFAWNISELGLAISSEGALDTYTLTKNSSGVAEAIPVSAIEIVTIYYTIQFQYPMVLPAQVVEVAGLPPTTAVFRMRPQGLYFGYVSPSQFDPSAQRMEGATAADGAGSVTSEGGGSVATWGINSMNRTTEFFGNFNRCAAHYWQLDPPITKNNTQVLQIETSWTFENATPIEV